MSKHSTVEQMMEMVASHRTATPKGVFSICSANHFVLEAGILQARETGSNVLIESTSNQVNQFGGYTGMTPAQFREYVDGLAAAGSLPRERVILGGDHLGPNAWQNESAEIAMAKARVLVADCVKAGYTKIHLDASMPCGDDPRGKALPDAVVASRAAELLKAAEDAAAEVGKAKQQVYVIGTEVPPPGGALEELSEIEPTSVEAASQTLEANRVAFEKIGFADAWPRVIGLVVQPGVEFGDINVVRYCREKAAALSRMMERDGTFVFEAHSTDYQPARALKELVQDHFGILKVGPWLTFALREAVFALASIEQELSLSSPSMIRQVLDASMVASPGHWAKHCLGSPKEQAFARAFGLSDRSRYYWPVADVQQALDRLIHNLTGHEIPLGLLSQYLPRECEAVTEGSLSPAPIQLIHHHIRTVLNYYHGAC